MMSKTTKYLVKLISNDIEKCKALRSIFHFSEDETMRVAVTELGNRKYSASFIGYSCEWEGSFRQGEEAALEAMYQVIKGESFRQDLPIDTSSPESFRREFVPLFRVSKVEEGDGR